MTSLREAVFVVPALSAIAERRGCFGMHDVELTRSMVTSSHTQLRDLVEGRVDVAITASDNLIVWNAGGADLVLVGQVESTTDLVLLLRPGLHLEDVDVLRLAVDAPTNGFAIVAFAMMQRLGRNRSAYEVVEVGGVAERFEALRTGAADATLVSAPLDEIGQDAGMTVVMRVGDLTPSYPGLGIVARRARVESALDAVAAYLGALEDARTWLHDAVAGDVERELASIGFGPAAVRTVLATLPASIAPTPEGLDVLGQLRKDVDMGVGTGLSMGEIDDVARFIDPRAAWAAGLVALTS